MIFDSKGVLLDIPSTDAIRAVRQICYLFQKIEKDCSTDRTRRAFSDYVKCEHELKEQVLPDLTEIRKVFLVLFGNLMDNVNRQIDDCSLVPKHGPGATADRLRGNRKWLQKGWPVRQDRYFPMDSYLIPNHRYVAELDRVELIEPGAEMPVRVITVPKTLKTPRIIAIEPTCKQYAQQAMLDAIRREINQDDLLVRLVGLDDQTPNRDLARTGSESGLVATLDLSEASDRVSNQLVFGLTRSYPSFAGALQACRSKKADVPGYGIIPLAKFASMGSAVCFPIEAMVFSTIATLGVVKQRGLPISPAAIRSCAADVRVFGDDIIIPSDSAYLVSELLRSFGMRVNTAKSFWTGRFRESCGGDYYAGVDVSVHRFRQEVPRTRHDARGVAALFSFRNQCYRAGYWKTVRNADSLLAALRVPLPRVLSTSPVLGRLSFLGYDTHRIDENLHSPMVRGMKIVSRPPVSPLRGAGALLKIFATRRIEPLREGHLERLGRPDHVYTKIGWGQPF